MPANSAARNSPPITGADFPASPAANDFYILTKPNDGHPQGSLYQRNGANTAWEYRGSDSGEKPNAHEGSRSSDVSNPNSNDVSGDQGSAALKEPDATPSPSPTDIQNGADNGKGKAKGHLKNDKARRSD